MIKGLFIHSLPVFNTIAKGKTHTSAQQTSKALTSQDIFVARNPVFAGNISLIRQTESVRKIDQPIPSVLKPDRLEYPRPMMVRDNWMSLKGEWQFEFDDEGKGANEGWFREDHPLSRKINVPYPYQSELSGINDKTIHKTVWYKKDFTLPDNPNWKGDKDIILNFGAVDYKSTVWVNGVKINKHKGGHVPFSMNIAPYLKAGKNQITVRVVDDQDPKQPRGKQASSGVAHVIDYFNTTGIWQDVWLEPVSKSRIEKVKITTDARNGVINLSVPLHAEMNKWNVEAKVFDGDKVMATAKVDDYTSVAQLRLKLKNPKLWSPESPHLYDIQIQMRDKEGHLKDEIGTYAGLRDVKLKHGKIYLNNKPVFLEMVLDQGFYEQSHLAAPSGEFLKKEVEWVKEFGFNTVRKHQKIEDPRWNYWCDKLGVMVWGEMANAHTDDLTRQTKPQDYAKDWSLGAEKKLIQEWEARIERDINHPSIIAWVPFNESWGLPDVGRNPDPRQLEYRNRVAIRTKELDPTRFVIDNDGWQMGPLTDAVGIHDYSKSREAFEKRYKDFKATSKLPDYIPHGGVNTFSPDAEHKGQPSFLTEYGGILEIPANTPPEKRDELYKHYSTWETKEEFVNRFTTISEGTGLLMRFMNGRCYTQLRDTGTELNGLLDKEGRPKLEPAVIRNVLRRTSTNKRFYNTRPLQQNKPQ